jgi:hypothetical protein
MRILVTFPGRIGDILWTMATVRAISETYGVPVDFACCASGKHFDSILPLLEAQSYIDRTSCLAAWQPREEGPDPFTPRVPALDAAVLQEYGAVYHLGYEGWPAPDLARDTYNRFLRLHQRQQPDQAPATLDLDRPWITPPGYVLDPTDLAWGFTDEYFELKYGLYWLLRTHYVYVPNTKRPLSWVNVSGSPRWKHEGGHGHTAWESAAVWIKGTRLFLGCCSALHVLACAIGTPAVLLEPAPGRWNDVFYPYGKKGPQVTLVLGSDGLPTTDARHFIETIDRMLEARRSPHLAPITEGPTVADAVLDDRGGDVLGEPL